MVQRLVALLLLPLLASTVTAAGNQAKPAAAEPAMKPGLWEISSISETRGATSKRTTTLRICYSAEDVRAPEAVLPPQRDFSMKCTTRDVKLRSGEVSWRLTCVGKDKPVSANGTGKMTLGNDAYTARVNLDSKEAGKVSKVEQTIAGKWVGNCP